MPNPMLTAHETEMSIATLAPREINKSAKVVLPANAVNVCRASFAK